MIKLAAYTVANSVNSIIFAPAFRWALLIEGEQVKKVELIIKGRAPYKLM
ncbi:hypothetical protein JM81_2847 [Maribacter sp. MAR_2009_72]|nr:hypothetical protein JM81_2847 [Maribacter sp. MAR_2009_72]